VKNLDYIQDLGFDAIWISPIVENTPGGYHGYWAKNISAVNENFGSEQDLVHLIDAAHRKDMWVMIDVVGNHMGGTINDISGFAPFNLPEHYHDCNGCDSSCDITDFNTQHLVRTQLRALPPVWLARPGPRQRLGVRPADRVGVRPGEEVQVRWDPSGHCA